MRLLLVSENQIAFTDAFQGIHPVPTLAIKGHMPFLVGASLTLKRGVDYFFEELAMAPRLIHQDQVGTAGGFFQRISDVAIWIDFQQVKLALLIHANVAATVARTVQTKKHLAGHVLEAFGYFVVVTLNAGHPFVVAPFEIEMLERLAARKKKLDRAIGERLKFIFGVLNYEHAKLAAIDKLFYQRGAKFGDHFLSPLVKRSRRLHP